MEQTFTSTAAPEKPRLSAQEELRIFRNLVRSLTSNAENALTDLGMWCKDADQLERLLLVQHHLDYMKRLCDGKV